MIMENNVLKFKSVPSMFYKELVGSKPNTARIITQTERNDIIQHKPIQIMICETGTHRNFVRQISDISYFQIAGPVNISQILCIISWFE